MPQIWYHGQPNCHLKVSINMDNFFNAIETKWKGESQG